MVTDRLGKTVATGRVYMVAGVVRRIEGSTDLLLVLGGGSQQSIRVAPSQVIDVDDLTFAGLAPASGGDPGVIASDGAGGWVFVSFAGWPDGALIIKDSAETGEVSYLTITDVRQSMACPYVLAAEAGDPVRTIGASSTAEATLCSLTIPGGTLGTTGKAILELVGDITNNSGSGNTFRPRVKLGSTTVYDKATSLATNSNPRPFVWRVHVCARGATNKQRVTIEILNGRPLAGSSGSGDWGEFTGYHFTAQGDAAENSASSLSVAVTMQNDVNNANIYCRLYSAKLIAIP